MVCVDCQREALRRSRRRRRPDAKPRRPKRTLRCTDPTHVRRPKGAYSYCKTCRDQLRQSRMPEGLIPDGMSVTSARALLAWVTKREKSTPEAISAQMRRIRAKVRPRPLKTHCIRGHALTERNVWVRRSRGRVERVCKQCVSERRAGRPQWVDLGGARVSIVAHDTFYRARHEALRDAMIAAHPDKGGTPRKFIDARQRLQSFEADEAAWYQQYGLKPPGKPQRARAKAA